MKHKDEMKEGFVEYMEEIGYDVPDEITGLDAINMSIAHWKNNLLRYHVQSTGSYCGLCNYFRRCDACPLNEFEDWYDVSGDPWIDGGNNGWRRKDIELMIKILEDIRDWMVANSKYLD